MLPAALALAGGGLRPGPAPTQPSGAAPPPGPRPGGPRVDDSEGAVRAQSDEGPGRPARRVSRWRARAERSAPVAGVGEGRGRALARRALLIAAVCGVVVAVDQLTKTWALDHLADGPRNVIGSLRLNLTFNSGVAFSQARGSTGLVTVVALVVLALLVVIARRTSGYATAAILGLVMGGAVGNLADRLVRHHGGAVIDFVDLRWWPVFNVADAAITVGVVIALARSLWGTGRTGSRERRRRRRSGGVGAGVRDRA